MHEYPTVPTSNRSFHYSVGGLNSVNEYLAPGLPFSRQVTATTGSATKVDFPMVTNEVYVKNNTASTIAVGWTENGCLGTNRYSLKENQNITFKIRVRSIFFCVVTGSTPSNIDIAAALTQIPASTFPVLTGSLARPEDGYIGSYSSGSVVYGQNGYNGIG